MGSIVHLLPPSLIFPRNLSAHKYIFVCTLTVAAWDTIVLSPRTWRMTQKSREWTALKIIFLALRYLMPIEVIIVGVMFFNSSVTQHQCSKFYLFEPIFTAALMTLSSAALSLRIAAIHAHSRLVISALSILVGLQIVAHAVACTFYQSVPLDVGQGCMAGPKELWVGIYWVVPTILYAATFALAVSRSVTSLQTRSMHPWKLMMRDGLNFYAGIFTINLINVLTWFIIKPNGKSDTIRTILTSMTVVLTCTTTQRVILLVRGSLASGGAFNSAQGSISANSNSISQADPRSKTGGGVNVSVVRTIGGHDGAPTFAVPEDDEKAHSQSFGSAMSLGPDRTARVSKEGEVYDERYRVEDEEVFAELEELELDRRESPPAVQVYVERSVDSHSI